MSVLTLLSDMDLSALLVSRVCHDVISPVGAIANGLEVLEDEDDEEMKQVAMDLVRRSARQASAKLQFCRIAFGAAGSAGAHVDMNEAGDLARGFVGEEKVRLDWRAPRETRPKAEVKLVLNMLLMGMSAIPRGGLVTVLGDANSFSVTATGEGARIPEKTAAVMKGDLPSEEMDARLVQPYYTIRLAVQAGYSLAGQAEPGQVRFQAERQ
jgi:histidine phosphotransferase ChpT